MQRISKAEAMARLEREESEIPPRFQGCAMCALAGGHPEDVELLAENEQAVAVLDRYACRPGHVLVILRRHAEANRELPWGEYAAVQRLVWEAARTLERVLVPQRVFVAALGSARQLVMSFPHHHVHVVPLFDGGTRDRPAEVFTWTHGVDCYEPGEASALGARLRAGWEGRS